MNVTGMLYVSLSTPISGSPTTSLADSFRHSQISLHQQWRDR